MSENMSEWNNQMFGVDLTIHKENYLSFNISTFIKTKTDRIK